MISINTNFQKGFFLILISLGFIWLRSSFGKITGGMFPQTLAPTLEKFISKNPYPWYTDFLKSSIIPNAEFFGQVIMWSEFAVAIAIVGGSMFLLINNKKSLAGMVLKIGLFGGIMLNLNFWLASSWTSPSTDSLNLLMAVIQIISLWTIFNMYNKTGRKDEVKE